MEARLKGSENVTYLHILRDFHWAPQRLSGHDDRGFHTVGWLGRLTCKQRQFEAHPSRLAIERQAPGVWLRASCEWIHRHTVSRLAADLVPAAGGRRRGRHWRQRSGLPRRRRGHAARVSRSLSKQPDICQVRPPGRGRSGWRRAGPDSWLQRRNLDSQPALQTSVQSASIRHSTKASEVCKDSHAPCEPIATAGDAPAGCVATKHTNGATFTCVRDLETWEMPGKSTVLVCAATHNRTLPRRRVGFGRK
jgi:hypothetical protein